MSFAAFVLVFRAVTTARGFAPCKPLCSNYTATACDRFVNLSQVYCCPLLCGGCGTSFGCCSGGRESCGLPLYNGGPGIGTASQASAWNAFYSCDYSTQFLTSASTPTAFGSCADKSSGVLGVTYYCCPGKKNPSPLAPLCHMSGLTYGPICGVISNCSLGVTFQSSAPTSSTDRGCSIVAKCTVGVNYQSAAPTMTSNRVCRNNVTSCTIGVNYQAVAPTTTTDRACESVTNCTIGVRYQSAAPTMTSNRVCRNVTTCTLGVNYQSKPPTLTSDQVCGNNVTLCTLGVSYQNQAPTTTSDRDCVAVTSCSLGVNYQSAAPTMSTNRACANIVTNCSWNGTWSRLLPTTTSNVRCSMPTTLCTLNASFQTEPPSYTSDRVCKDVTQCSRQTEYELRSPTLMSNRVCANISSCAGAQPYQLNGPTATTNRACTNASCVGFVQDITFVKTRSTTTTTAQCANLTVCNPPLVILAQPTATTDRSCLDTCPTGCHETSGRMCSCASSSDEAALSTAQIAAIVVGAVVFFVLSGVALFVVGRRLGANDRRRVEQAEMQLFSARQENAESAATVRRIMSAWEIPADHLTFLERLAEGTYGTVWKGLWGSQPVAVKVLKRHDDDFVTEFFRKECEALQSVKHPNLIVFFGAGTTADGKPFMVTELMAGGSLRMALHDALQQIDWLVRVRIAQQIAAGMCHLHTLQIVHRDLKSDNVLLDGDVNAKVADFGTSRTLSAAMLDAPAVAETRINSASLTKAVGTQLWMAPEVFLGNSKYGPEVDVYSFGIIMWELITRKDPWFELGATDYITQFRLLDEALRADRRPSVPEGFEAEHSVYVATMQKCWATEPAARPSFDTVVSLLSLVPAASPTRTQVLAAAGSRHALRGVYATVDIVRSGSDDTAAPQIYE